MSIRRRVRHDERGVTLVELLAALAAGGIVLAGVLTFSITGVNASLEVEDRAEAAQRGRQALDRMVTVLQSQVCIDAARPPIATGDANAVTFYADTSSETFRPRQHRFAYDPATKRITESIHAGIGTPPAIVFVPSPTEVRAVAAGVTPVPGRPLLRYYAFTSTQPTTASVELPVPLSVADARRVVRVAVAFNVAPSRTGRADRRSTTIEGDAYVGSLEATTDPQLGPRCT